MFGLSIEVTSLSQLWYTLLLLLPGQVCLCYCDCMLHLDVCSITT